MPYALTCDLCGDVLMLDDDNKKPYVKLTIPASAVRERFPSGTNLYVCNDCIESKLFAVKDSIDQDLAVDLEPHLDGTGIPHE